MAVGQAGERIQIDQIVNVALCQHALRQVALEFHVVDDLALRRANGYDQYGFTQRLAIAGAIGHLSAPDRARGQLRQRTLTAAKVHANGRNQFSGLAQHLFALVARADQKGIVDIDHLELGIGDDNALGVLLDCAVELAQLVLAGLESGQHFLPFLHPAAKN